MSLLRIIALDLGKFKSVACVMDARTRAHRFATVDTTPAAVHGLLAACAGADPSRALVVLEACDCAGGCTTSPRRWAAASPSPTPATRRGSGGG